MQLTVDTTSTTDIVFKIEGWALPGKRKKKIKSALLILENKNSKEKALNEIQRETS